MAVTPATPRILPAMISGTEADDSSTSRMRLPFSSMTLLSSRPAPVKITDHRSTPIITPATDGRRSRIDTAPWPAAFGE